MMRQLSKFARDTRGVAAVELALVLPVIVGMFLGAYSLWDAASRRQDLRSALNAGAEYYMNGGSDDSVASAAVTAAWQRRPPVSTVAITRSCKCDTVVLACTSLCAANVVQSIYVEMKLTANDPSAPVSQSLLESRVVRVR